MTSNAIQIQNSKCARKNLSKKLILISERAISKEREKKRDREIEYRQSYVTAFWL